MMNVVLDELSTLEQMSTNELCERYLNLFGQPVRTRHKAYLVRKIAWRIQALAEGDLSERARKRAAENDPPHPRLARLGASSRVDSRTKGTAHGSDNLPVFSI